ncbi:uncharacterized protein OCT59_006415 [Rhizophagus irregularis]|nr:hypothetical protein OCT59_006415 [Rhizophagus irregularis]
MILTSVIIVFVVSGSILLLTVLLIVFYSKCVKDSINKLSKQQNEIAEVKIIIEDQNTSVRQQKRIGIDENNLNEEFNKLRHELITTVFYESRFAARGNDLNEKYEHQLYIIDQHEKLTVAEKVETKRRITFDKDFRNLLFLKGPKYKCALCGRSGYTNYTCEHCSRDVLKSEFVNWSSGNEVIDEAIRKSQMILPLPGWIQEWIPFSELENMKYKTRGGCATIYTAIWTKGYMKEFDNEKRTFGRSGPYKVIMKRLEGSSIADTKYFKELTLHLTLRGHGCQVVHCCGVTRDPESDDFMLVMVEMESDLYHYIQENLYSITAKEVYNILRCICSALVQIHDNNLVHRDLHSGNVLRRSDTKWFISDLGLCGPADKPPTSIYGNLPYIAPEVLRLDRFTPKADIYSLGMLMYEILTGFPPFHDRVHDCHLAIDIVSGIRPTIPPDLPDTLKYLMEQCWDNNPEARPTSAKLHEYFSENSGSKLHDFGDLLRNCNVTKSNMGSNQQSSYETIQDKLAISVESVTSDSSVV